MRLVTSLFSILMLACSVACSQQVRTDLLYLGQKTPGATPEIFAPGLVSLESEYEFGSVFNKESTEFYYGVDLNGKSEIRYSKLVGEEWTKPKTILSDPQYGYNDPFLSPDEQRLYFISQKALSGPGAKGDYDIWYVEKKQGKWSEPINAGPNINTGKDEYYISFTHDGTMYFSSNKNGNSFDIYTSKSIAGTFQEAKRLGAAVNTSHYEADVFVAPDEAYVIFCANRPEGLGRGDLYISFKQADGSWTKSISMGNKINTSGHELCPFVSMDGQYFFYTSNQDIYWVSTSVFSELKAQAME